MFVFVFNVIGSIPDITVICTRVFRSVIALYRQCWGRGLTFRTAGYLADMNHSKFLLPVTTLAMLLRVINISCFAHAVSVFISLCFEYFAESFCLMCYIVYFLDLARRTKKPALWAGKGRAIALPVTALSANLFGVIINDFADDAFLAFYIICLGLVHIVFYHESFRQELEPDSIKKYTAPVLAATNSLHIPLTALDTGNTSDRMDEYQKRFAFTPREMEVLSEILLETPTAEIAEKLGIKERTIKYHIANILRKTGTTNQPELRLLLRMQ